jgi:uncharacterized coiled-coil DUF342 family protein
VNDEKLRAHLDELHRQMLERDGAFRFHDEELRKRDHEIEQLTLQVQQLRDEVASVQQWARELERNLLEMRATRAWRLAERLRRLKRLGRS